MFQTQICTITVWSRVWLNDKQVTQHACTSRTKRDGLLGAPTSVNVTRTDILKMATYAVTTLNGLQGKHNSLDQVISAKTQVCGWRITQQLDIDITVNDSTTGHRDKLMV